MLDYRGFGKTGLGGKPITMKQHADDTAGLMDALKITRANVLGWSLGTYVAQEFVLAYPEKTKKVVLYAADFGGDRSYVSEGLFFHEIRLHRVSESSDSKRITTTLATTLGSAVGLPFPVFVSGRGRL